MKTLHTIPIVLLVMLSITTGAQENRPTGAVESGQSSIQMPEIQPNAAPKEEETTGFMSGEKPFSLTVEPNGELQYDFSQETNELESITAKKGVVFTSEDMTLHSDKLNYNTVTSELVATGESVAVRMGEVIATCQVFKHFPSDQHSELTGNPLLYNRTRDGKVTTTAGQRITIVRVNGKPQVRVEAGPRQASLSSAGSNPPNVMNIPAEGTNAVMSFGEVTTAPASTRTGSSSPVPGAAPPTTSGSPRSEVVPSARPAGGGLLAVPSFGSEGTASAPAARPNKIDLGSPAEVSSFRKSPRKN